MYKHIIIKQELHRSIKKAAFDLGESVACITAQLIYDFLLMSEEEKKEVVLRAKATKKQTRKQ